MLLGAWWGDGRGGIIFDVLYQALAGAILPLGVLLVSLSGLAISLIFIFNGSIEKLLLGLRWLLTLLGAVLVKLGEGAKSLFMYVKEVVSGLSRWRQNRPEAMPLPILETALTKPFKVNGGLEIMARPAEPVTEGVKTPAPKEVTATSLTTQQILKEETVTNLPLSDKVWIYPPLSLLSDASPMDANRGDIKERADIIERTLGSFGIRVKVVEVNQGPAVTQYALAAVEGTKLARIVSLQNDLASALSSPNGQIRIEAPIPGRSLVGIEVPNFSPSLVTLKSILTSEAMKSTKSKLAVALGHDVGGQPVIADLSRMPHILVAGSTGSGKSVLINSFISTLLFRASPAEVKLILIDPKRVEFAAYNDIPHLHTPVIVEPDKALFALKWAVGEMERRYKLLERARARNITSYNELSGFQAMPYFVIVVDEFANLMHIAPVEIEKAVCRIAQMARAVGIHLVLATQRPSVDVLTGLIKANIPTRLAFNVTSQVDSRVVLDQPGAEKLLGRGDMLYVPPEASKPQRIQGVYVSDGEINALTDFLRNSQVAPEYNDEVVTPTVGSNSLSGSGLSIDGRDSLFEEAKAMVEQSDKASASLLQRRFRIGYPRAVRLLDELQAAGVVGPADGSKPRDVYSRNGPVSSPLDDSLDNV